MWVGIVVVVVAVMRMVVEVVRLLIVVVMARVLRFVRLERVACFLAPNLFVSVCLYPTATLPALSALAPIFLSAASASRRAFEQPTLFRPHHAVHPPP